MEAEKAKSEAKQRLINDFINNATLPSIVELLIKEASIKADEYLKTLSEEQISSLVVAAPKPEDKPVALSWIDKSIAFINQIKKKIGINSRRKGFVTRKGFSIGKNRTGLV